MRIAFVKPAWRYPITKVEHTYNRRWPPLDLLNCGAIAERQGHDVQIVDAHVDGLSPEAVAERVGSADILFVTSSALDRWQCPNLELEPVTAVTQRLRDGPGRLFLMGFHGTVEPEAMLKMTGVDAVIRGEPEDTVGEIAEGISRYILSRGIRVRWCCQTRPDLVEGSMLRLMKRAGCRLIHFGVETGSERIAGLMRKMVPIERQRAGLELAKRMGLETLCYFLLGYPGETEEEMLETIRLAKSLNPHYAVFHRISPYQGTALYEGLDGRTEDLFPAFAGTPEEREVVDRMVRRAFWESYVRPRYVFSRLFRSSPPSLWRQLRLFAGYFR